MINERQMVKPRGTPLRSTRELESPIRLVMLGLRYLPYLSMCRLHMRRTASGYIMCELVTIRLRPRLARVGLVINNGQRHAFRRCIHHINHRSTSASPALSRLHKLLLR